LTAASHARRHGPVSGARGYNGGLPFLALETLQ